MKKGVLLFSGGIDSTTLLYYLLGKGWTILPLIVNYGSKHNHNEIEAAKATLRELGVGHIIFDMRNFADICRSSLTCDNLEIPNKSDNDISQLATVVPLRNAMLIMLASSVALDNGMDNYSVHAYTYNVFISAVKDDQKIYRDCRPKFFRKLGKALTSGCEYESQVIKIRAPFVKKSKKDIIKLGLKLGVDYNKTYTCYKGEERPCLVCDACVERQEAFYKNGVEDPLLTKEEWNSLLVMKAVKEVSNWDLKPDVIEFPNEQVLKAMKEAFKK